MPHDLLSLGTPFWVEQTPPEEWIAVASQCTLSRNLSDFAFPSQCSDDERRAVEGRVLDAMERINLFGAGRYFSGGELNSLFWQFLGERRLASRELLHAHGSRGIYVSEDQSFSVMVNGADHVVFRQLLGGMFPREAWQGVNRHDDSLSGLLDFAFDGRLGFLTSRLGMVGTGLRAGVLLHLPALGAGGGLEDKSQSVRQFGLDLFGLLPGDQTAPMPGPPQGRAFSRADAPDPGWEPVSQQCLLTDLEGGVCTGARQTVGDLYLLVNQESLGVTEDEIVFRVAHGAAELVQEEHQARMALHRRGALTLEDRVYRALSLARGARLLGFCEAADLLSQVRLGAALGILDGPAPRQLTGLLLACQGAHLSLLREAGTEPESLSAARAALLREALG